MIIRFLYALLRKLPLKFRTRLFRTLERAGLEKRLAVTGETVYRHDGRRIRVDLADHVGRQMFKHGWYEYAYVVFIRKWLTQRRGLFLDVGSNVGNYCLALAPFYDKTLAFEPNPSIFSALRANCARNPQLEIKPIQLGLSSRAARLTFHLGHAANSGVASLENSDAGGPTIGIDVAEGDSYVDSDSVVAAIKIDVEGHELEVLRGLNQTLTRDRPDIFMEWHTAVMQERGGLAALAECLPNGYQIMHSINKYRVELRPLKPPYKTKYNMIFCLPNESVEKIAIAAGRAQ